MLDEIRVGERLTQTLDFPFEDLVPDGLLDDTWEPDGQWTIVDTGGFTDEYAWSLNPGGENQRNTDFSLTLGGVVELPGDALDLKLSYQDHFELASDTTLAVEISSDDAQTWTALETFSAGDNTADWTPRVISLDGYAGETIRIRFRALQGSAWTSDAWEIDDLRVTGEEAATATSAPEETATETPPPPTATAEGSGYQSSGVPGLAALRMSDSLDLAGLDTQSGIGAQSSALVNRTITYQYDPLGRLHLQEIANQ